MGTVSAQTQHLKFYSEEILGEGKENIFQDSYGFIWIASYEGVERWDGSTLKKYEYNPHNNRSLSSNICYTFYEDHAHRLWVGSINGLNLYHREKDEFERCSLADSTLKVPINSIKEDSKHQLWLGTSAGLCQYDVSSQKGKWIKECGFTIFPIVIDENDKIWAGTFSNGLLTYDIKTNKSDVLLRETASGIKSLMIDNKQNIWLGTFEQGIFKINPKGEILRSFPQFNKANVKCIFQDHEKNIWVGLEGLPLQYMAHGKNNFEEINHHAINNYFRLSNTIINICEDSFGNLWFTTKGNGVMYTNFHKNKISLHFNKAEVSGVSRRSTITSFCEDEQGNFWVGTEGGLGFYNRKDESYQFITQGLSSLLIQDVKIDKNQNLWIATWGGGLIQYNTKNQSTKSYDVNCKNIKSIWIDGDIIWIGSHGGGLATFNINTKKTVLISEEPIWINHLFKDSKNRLWVSSYSGILLLENNQKTFFKENTNAGSLANNSVNMIAEDANHNIWIVSESGGLQRFDEISHSFTPSQKELPLCIKSVVFDNENNAWLGTIKGLICFNLKNKTQEKYDAADGFQGNIYVHKACLKSKNGELFFGGMNGFNNFFTKNLKHQLPATQIYLGEFQYQDKIEINESESNLNINFSVIDLYNPTQLKIAYQIKGLNDQWIEIGAQKIITLNYLPAGNYHLLFKYSYGNNEWKIADKKLQIHVLAPFWKSTWFIISVLLLISVAAYLYYKSIQQKNELLEEQMAEKKDELLIQNETIDLYQIEQERQENKIIAQQNQLLHQEHITIEGDENLDKIKGKKIQILLANEENISIAHSLLAKHLELLENELVAENLPDFILTDQNEKVVALKRNTATSHLPVLLIVEQNNSELPSFSDLANKTILKKTLKEKLWQELAELDEYQKELQNKMHPSFQLYNESDKEFFNKIAEIIEKHFSEPDFNHEILCEQLNISRTVLYAKIKSITGLGVHEFIRMIRLKKSAELLIEGKLNVSQIAYQVGFNSVSYFIRCFTKAYGVSPKEYARVKR